MDTKTVTLTEFLLARIAEDGAHPDASLPAWTDGVRTQNRRERECESKRRVVGECRYWIDEDGHYGVAACEAILRRLATVYSDHPDYREEWRA